jgi:hypothetical protein
MLKENAMNRNSELMNFLIIIALSLFIGYSSASKNVQPSEDSWYFAVSGDSRDCGNLIMPQIAV